MLICNINTAHEFLYENILSVSYLSFQLLWCFVQTDVLNLYINKHFKFLKALSGESEVMT